MADDVPVQVQVCIYRQACPKREREREQVESKETRRLCGCSLVTRHPIYIYEREKERKKDLHGGVRLPRYPIFLSSSPLARAYGVRFMPSVQSTPYIYIYMLCVRAWYWLPGTATSYSGSPGGRSYTIVPFLLPVFRVMLYARLHVFRISYKIYARLVERETIMVNRCAAKTLRRWS